MTTKNRFNCTWKIWKQDSINLLHHLSILDLVELFLNLLNILKRISRLELCVCVIFFSIGPDTLQVRGVSSQGEVRSFFWSEGKSIQLKTWQMADISHFLLLFLTAFFSVLKKKHSLNKNTHERTPYMTCLE